MRLHLGPPLHRVGSRLRLTSVLLAIRRVQADFCDAYVIAALERGDVTLSSLRQALCSSGECGYYEHLLERMALFGENEFADLGELFDDVTSVYIDRLFVCSASFNPESCADIMVLSDFLTHECFDATTNERVSRKLTNQVTI